MRVNEGEDDTVSKKPNKTFVFWVCYGGSGVAWTLVILTDFLEQLLYVNCISGTGLHKYGSN